MLRVSAVVEDALKDSAPVLQALESLGPMARVLGFGFCV